MNQIGKYRDWDILDRLPDGWAIDRTAGSPAPRTVFITNGKSLLSGEQKRALLKVEAIPHDYTPKYEIPKEDKQREVQHFDFPARTVNDLARKKFQSLILRDIVFDLMVCEIEGWDKTEYIEELKTMLNGIKNKDLQWEGQSMDASTSTDH